MGRHVGWRVVGEGGKWRGMVRVAGRYRSRMFSSERDARVWARSEASRVQLGGGGPGGPGGVPGTVAMAAEYLADLELRGRRASTLRDLRTLLGSFARGVPRLDGAQAAAQVRSWWAELGSTGKGRGGKGMELAGARRNKYLVNARALCRWAMGRYGLAQDPTAGLRSASVEHRLRPQFSLEECALLLGGKPSASRRWVALMLLAGLRADEARTLRWGDIDWSAGILMVALDAGGRVKRRRERIVPIQPALADVLGPAGPAAQAVVGLRPGNLPRAFRDYCAARRIDINGRSAHSCRHSYAGMMTATGCPSALLGAYLGHSSAQTTLGYTGMAARYAMDPGPRSWPRGVLLLGAASGLAGGAQGARPAA